MTNSGKLPLYLAIKNELEGRILSGQLAVGEKFPSEAELSKEFGVSTSTIKRAIGVLVSDGLVERTPGKGTFVSTHRIETPLRSFSEEMRSRGLVAGSQLLEEDTMIAHGELAWHLEVPEETEVFYVHRLRTANDAPVALDETFIPKAFCPTLLEHNLSSIDIERLLEEKYQLSMVRAEEFVTARLAVDSEKEILGAGEGPLVLLVVERQVDGVGNQRIMYNRTLYRADRYILHFDLKRY